jgi:hypothetical protein
MSINGSLPERCGDEQRATAHKARFIWARTQLLGRIPILGGKSASQTDAPEPVGSSKVPASLQDSCGGPSSRKTLVEEQSPNGIYLTWKH